MTFPRGPSQPLAVRGIATPLLEPGAVPATLIAFRDLFSSEPNCFANPFVLLASILTGSSELHSLRACRGESTGEGRRDGGKLLRSEGGWRGSFWERIHCISQSSCLHSTPKMANRGHITMVYSQALMPAPWRVQDISSAFKWTAPSATLSKGKFFPRKKMPKPMAFSTKKFLSPSRGTRSPQSPQGQSLSKRRAPGT